MTEVNLTINGRNYGVDCDPGQEHRVLELAAYVDERVRQIAKAGAAQNDAHLLVLASLVLADELSETKNRQASHAAAVSKKGAAALSGLSRDEEATLAKVLDHLTGRIEALAARLEAA